MVHYLHREQSIPAPVEKVWAYFCDPRNLNALTPPNMNFEILQGGDAAMYEGQIIEYRVEFLRGVRSLWLTEIAHVREGAYFVDEQRMGPYRFWYHEHFFEQEPGATRMMDQVTYAIPFGMLGDLLNAVWISRRLENIFNYRMQKIIELFGGNK
ncbi:MAG: cell division inhibitor [Anaerolineales bacterium]|nr:SRPBCC family protein [Anaerolineae bacterium]PWB75681.1 MAG: cell division inhibitor [Anaerolineales bacterium]